MSKADNTFRYNFVSVFPGYTLGYMSNEDQSYDLYE